MTIPSYQVLGWRAAAAVVLLVGVVPRSFAAMEWTYPQPLNSNAAVDGTRQDYYPSLAADDLGTWVAVWASRDLNDPSGPLGADMDILSSRSVDNGATWSLPAAVDAAAATDDLHDSSPDVYSDRNGHWIAVWNSWDQGANSDQDLLVAASTDGLSWTVPAHLNSDWATDATRDHDYTPHLAADGAGNWVAVWFKKVDSPPGDEGDIYVSRSSDHGVTWTPLALLHPSMAADPGNDIVPRIATDGVGNWVVTWRSDNLIGTSGIGDNDIHVSSSTDGGVTWTAPAALNTDAPTDGQDDLEGTVATDRAGTWLAAWYRANMGGTDRDLLFAHSTDGGATWTSPAPLNSTWETDSGDDARPRLAADGLGNWVCVWYSRDTLGLPIGTDRDVFFARSCDDGRNWTSPGILNGNAGSDLSAHDWSHEVTLGADGLLLAAWYTTDSLGGTVGPDRDILFSTAMMFACGDADVDGDRDLKDFSRFQACHAPGGPLAFECDRFDFDGDAHVGLEDFSAFEAGLTGPGG